MRSEIPMKISTVHSEDSGMMAMDGSIGNLRKNVGHNGWSSLMERQCGMSSTMQVLEFWRWKRMEIDAEIAKHPERQDLHIWRSQITVRIEQLQKQVYKEEAEKRA